MDHIETGDYNNDTNINDLKTINLKKKHQGHNNWPKKIIKNIGIYQERNHIAGLIWKHSRDVLFLKQVPVHPKDRLAKKTKDEVKFVK